MKQYLPQSFGAPFCLILSSIPSAPLFATTLQQQEHAAASYTDLVNVTIGLAIVLGIFFVIMYGCKLFLKGYSHNSGHLKIIDRIHLGNRESLLIVEYHNHQHILLAVTPGSIRQIQTTPNPKIVPSKDEGPAPGIHYGDQSLHS